MDEKVAEPADERRRQHDGPEIMAILKRHLVDRVPLSEVCKEFDVCTRRKTGSIPIAVLTESCAASVTRYSASTAFMSRAGVSLRLSRTIRKTGAKMWMACVPLRTCRPTCSHCRKPRASPVPAIQSRRLLLNHSALAGESRVR